MQRYQRIIALVVGVSLALQSWPCYSAYSPAIKCLALNDYYEARGESYEGRIAVAEVVLNRSKHSSICRTISEYGQFSWLGTTRLITDKTQWDNSLKIATALLDPESTIKDPTQGATYYHHDGYHVKWDKGMAYTTIGNHRFYIDVKEYP